MAKKKSDKPKGVCLPLDRLSIQIGFLDNVRAGYLFKLIVYYCLGDNDMVDQLLKEISGMSDHSLIEMAFQENKVIIDVNMKKWSDKCEKNRQTALEREERKRAWKESQKSQQTSTDVESSSTNVHDCAQTTTNTNTDTITDTTTITDTNISSLHSEISVGESGSNNSSLAPAPTKEELILEKFKRRLRQDYPAVAELQMPDLTQLTNIYQEAGQNWEKVFLVCAEMQNKTDINTKYRVFYTTYKKFKAHM